MGPRVRYADHLSRGVVSRGQATAIDGMPEEPSVALFGVSVGLGGGANVEEVSQQGETLMCTVVTSSSNFETGEK